MSRQVAVTGALLTAVIVVLLLAVLGTSRNRGEPCVDYVPANVMCAPDSPAVPRAR
jgi:hypothetical protein